MREVLEQLLDRRDLTVDQAGDVLRAMTDPEVSEAVKGAVLTALRAKGETADEIRGMAMAMRDAARAVDVGDGPPLIDTCGTGGDGSHAINISTAASFVLAACGLRVVKHGNRSISSKSGSADVLEALGIALPTGPEQAVAQLQKTGWTFLFAPYFHPAMKAVVPVRRAMRIRTAFNLLGPLTNPARPAHQVVGAFSVEACELMANALAGMPIERCAVVFGDPGWDEATPMGPFHRWDVIPGQVEHTVVDPRDEYGVERCRVEELAGGEASENAAALRAVFDGTERGPHRDAIVLNAAIALQTVQELSGRDAVAMAGEAIDSGRVDALLQALR